MDTAFLDALAKNWCAIALRGVFAIVFAILAVLMPGNTLAVLLLPPPATQPTPRSGRR